MKHRQALNAISQGISQTDLEHMVFICEGEVLPESTAEGIQSAIGLFRELEHRTFLGPGKYEFLKEVLVSVGRNDLASTLDSLTNSIMEAVSDDEDSVVHSSSSRSILIKISNQLRREDVRKMAYLCCCKSDRGISLMEELEHKRKISNNNYSYLAERLSDIGRYDLSQLLLSYVAPKVIDDTLSLLVQCTDCRET